MGILGLELAWLAYMELGGFKTFEGVRRVNLDVVGDADEARDMSEVVGGPRSFETGN